MSSPARTNEKPPRRTAKPPYWKFYGNGSVNTDKILPENMVKSDPIRFDSFIFDIL